MTQVKNIAKYPKAVLAVFCLLLIMAYGYASAAPVGDVAGPLNYGAVQCATTATAIPAAPMASRNAVGIVNLGPNIIYIGDSSVTTATGFPVAANGGAFSLDSKYAHYNGPKLYCISAVLQVSPSDSRFLEGR